MAIGLATSKGDVIALSAAVICHKWAEGLTLGMSYANNNIPIKLSTIMITISACCNPIGIGIGWLLSNQGDLITGIFMSISSGILYILYNIN